MAVLWGHVLYVVQGDKAFSFDEAVAMSTEHKVWPITYSGFVKVSRSPSS